MTKLTISNKGCNRDRTKPKTETPAANEYEPKFEKKVKVEFVENEVESNSTLTAEGSLSRKSPVAGN